MRRALRGRYLLAALALGAAAASGWLAAPRSEAPVVAASNASSAEPEASCSFVARDEAAAARASKRPERPMPRTAARFSRMRVARAAAGIRCPDGTCLPPLNGVLPTDPIPPIERERSMPAIGAIVGRYTDDTGADWWVTEDGSAFTTRWQEITMADGKRARVVRLDQSDACGDRFAARAR